ncbi:hypothetical protein A1O3_00529 [Capronia epimyces CBS 606.96]|uniref:Uncharacterized protein n=1 Tax=Capronia epimyces CBS 606.96 TaxID=1182542 RepID=W9ZBU5_9EURO|nr:uncharacterized protein A1O3_00529 [Capronia epimyces CBS 606.96]EXJ91979.1 hypothetical protein A1O3_00529 [Capronia epimyces CBS 606.96]
MAPTKKKRSRHKCPSPLPLKTVDCSRCGAPIIIPKQCKHGKKLINCQGTDCCTAHVTDHNNQCHSQITNPRVEDTSEETKTHDKEHKQRKLLSLLVMQEIKNVERMRGKEMRYLNGVPKAEFLRNLKTMDLEQARVVAQKLKEVGEGIIDLDTAMYDDEDSGSDNDPCQTPPEENEAWGNPGEDDARCW